MAAVTNKGENCKVPAHRSRDPENQDPGGTFSGLEHVFSRFRFRFTRRACRVSAGVVPLAAAVYLYTVRPCRGEGTCLYERNAFLIN